MGRGKSSNKKKKLNKQKQLLNAEAEGSKVPRSFIFHRGKIGKSIETLIQDMRKVMSPYTALKLQERKSNSLKDFLSIAPQYNVSHFMIFNQTEKGTNMRLLKVPQGPSITFRVISFSLMKDIANVSKKSHSPGGELLTPPLLVMNNFNTMSTSSMDQNSMKIKAAMLQSLFPALDLDTIKVNNCKRVVLFNYHANTETIEFRHYIIVLKATGVHKVVKKMKTKIVDDVNMKIGALEMMGDIA